MHWLRISRLGCAGTVGLLLLLSSASPVAAQGREMGLVPAPPPVADSMAGTSFTPFGPVRLVDSRYGLGLPSALSNGVPTAFAVAGAAGIPAGTVAVSGNLTITQESGRGYVSLTSEQPAGTPGTSTLNTPQGDDRANGVITALSSTGTLWATAIGMNCAIIFDATGYFTPDPAGSSWYPLLPARLLDTRSGLGLASSLTSGAPRTLPVAGLGGVPVGATAVTGNLTVVAQGAGYLAVTTAPTARPGTSTLNFPAGEIRANNLIAPLATNGSLSLTYVGSSSVAAIFDVTGYFMADAGGALFVPLSATRVLDSRVPLGLGGPFTRNAPLTLSLAGLGLDPSTLAISGNLTVTDVSGAGYAYVQPAAGPILTSNLNAPASDTRANGFVSRLGASQSLAVGYQAVSGGADLVLDLTGYFVSANPALTDTVHAAFDSPAPGTTEVSSSGERISWTVADPPASIDSLALIQMIATATGPGCADDWAAGLTMTVSAGAFTYNDYAPGHCYRYELVINGNPNSAVFSGISHSSGPASKVPVLMYHLVDPVVGGNLAGLVVDPAVFDSEMKTLYDAGWRTITAADLGGRLATHAVVPDKSFVVTFDDGNVDDYTYAYPILKKYGFVATFYIVTGRTGGTGSITWDQAAEMTRSGSEIASHTVSHVEVTYLTGAGLDAQIGASKTAIENNLAARGLTVSVTTFCYPFGGFSVADENYLRTHGFTAAFTEEPGAVRVGQNVEGLPRVRVPRSYSASQLLTAMNQS